MLLKILTLALFHSVAVLADKEREYRISGDDMHTRTRMLRQLEPLEITTKPTASSTTKRPTGKPTKRPTEKPTTTTNRPTGKPTKRPTGKPTKRPTGAPTASTSPSSIPSSSPSSNSWNQLGNFIYFANFI